MSLLFRKTARLPNAARSSNGPGMAWSVLPGGISPKDSRVDGTCHLHFSARRVAPPLLTRASVFRSIRTVILPKENGKDIHDLPPEVKRALDIHLVEEMAQVLEIALVEKPLAKKPKKALKSAKAQTGQHLPPPPLLS